MDKLWAQMDISKWEILEDFGRIDRVLLVRDKIYGCSKQHPRKMSMVGTDEKEYRFLLKGHEDLRQDERAMQLFDLVNTIVSNNRKTSNKNLFIITYSVIPLSHNAGIIGWVENCDTLHQIIKDERAKNNK